jgi:hypothetical protein
LSIKTKWKGIVAAAVFLVIFTVIQVKTYYGFAASNLSDSSKVVELFKAALAPEGPDDNPVLNRLGSYFKICGYGNQNKEIQFRISSFIDLVSDHTRLKPSVRYRKTSFDCPTDTLMYIWIHNNIDRISQANIDIHNREISHIVGRHGYSKTVDVKVDNYAYGLTFVEDGKQPILFSGINELLGADNSLNKLMAHNIVQQELFQLIMIARDVSVQSQPHSIIEERELGDDFAHIDPYTIEYTREQFRINVSNLCVNDIILMLTLYSEDEFVLDGKLNSYLHYLNTNFIKLRNRAQEIQNNPKYADIFIEKC